MVVSTVRRKLTYEDLLRIPEDGLRHEILDGVHVVTPAPATLHQRASWRLNGRFFVYLEAHPIGEAFSAPFDVVLARHDVVEPDLLYLSKEKRNRIGRANVQGAPDLAVEILSPSSRRIDLDVKRARYEKLGVGEYWVLDPENKTAAIYRRRNPEAPRYQEPIALAAEADERLTTPLLPGLEISLQDVFADVGSR